MHLRQGSLRAAGIKRGVAEKQPCLESLVETEDVGFEILYPDGLASKGF